jgi:hypothetical protein
MIRLSSETKAALEQVAKDLGGLSMSKTVDVLLSKWVFPNEREDYFMYRGKPTKIADSSGKTTKEWKAFVSASKQPVDLKNCYPTAEQWDKFVAESN